MLLAVGGGAMKYVLLIDLHTAYATCVAARLTCVERCSGLPSDPDRLPLPRASTATSVHFSLAIQAGPTCWCRGDG